jgi:hypothetical protein
MNSLLNWGAWRHLRWGRVLVSGICAELAVFAILFSVLHFWGQTAFLASILVTSASLPFLFALWVDSRVESHFVLHGLLVGVVAALMYVIVALGAARTVPLQGRTRLKAGGRIPGWHCFGALDGW